MKERHKASDIRSMCSWLHVSRSGYYSYLRAAERPVSESEMKDRDLVRWAYGFRGRSKGARQIKMTLSHEKGIIMNFKKVRRVMKDIRLSYPIRKANPLRRMARAMKTDAVFSNKLNRQFATTRPGQHLLTDISYIYYGANGRCYLSTVKDASTNEILAWTVSESLGIGFVLEMLGQLERIDWLPHRFVLHSDQGCHYTSIEYRKFLSRKEITQSMSRLGNCWDNAPMESFFGHAKDELHLRECLCFSQVCREIASYMDYYNHSRCQWGRRRMTPVEYREFLLSQPKLEVMVLCDQKYLHGLAHEGIGQQS